MQLPRKESRNSWRLRKSLRGSDMFMGGSRLSVCVCVCVHVHASMGAHFAVNVSPDPRAFSSFQKPQHTVGTFKGKAVLGSSRDFKGFYKSSVIWFIGL